MLLSHDPFLTPVDPVESFEFVASVPSFTCRAGTARGSFPP